MKIDKDSVLGEFLHHFPVKYVWLGVILWIGVVVALVYAFLN